MSLLPSSVSIIGHRGAAYDAPENTLASVRMGWDQGADAVEIDVWLTRDRRIVAVHDATLARYGGPDVPIGQLSLAELQSCDVGLWKSEQFAGERVPLLRHVLATVPAGKRLLVEIKCGLEIVEPLLQELTDAGTLPSSCELIGFGFETMSAIKQALPDFPVFLVSHPYRANGENWSPDCATLLKMAEQGSFDGIDLHAGDFVTRDVVERLNKAGLTVYVWTVNDVELARRMIDAGVVGLTTDRPGWLRGQLDR